ncbi:MAG TPA: hypothetical protein VFQ78_11915 [Candidatus Udaeobacter sp.]|nr:hypothetical protein [Candidatus Udaeobacter sp.]
MEIKIQSVDQVQDVLVKVKPLINSGIARVSAESIKKLNEISTRLGDDIIKKT